MSRQIFLLAVLFDVLCLAVISVLLWYGVLPKELGTGLLGAVIGVRARWASDHNGGQGGKAFPTDAPQGRLTPNVGGAAQGGSEVVRGALSESTLGVLFGWARAS